MNSNAFEFIDFRPIYLYNISLLVNVYFDIGRACGYTSHLKLETISKKSFGSISALAARFKSSK